MAKRSKVSKKVKQRFAQRTEGRKGGIRNQIKYFLIVCEGEKTEPHYFEALKKDLPNDIRLKIEGTGKNTLSLVDEVIRIRDKKVMDSGIPFEQTCVVFDRDNFPKQNFNSAIQRCYDSTDQINCAWSNEAFELWYLLHFQFFQHAMSRHDYQKLLEREISKSLGKGRKFKYKKSSDQMYEVLKEHGDLSKAISNAKSLEILFEGDSNYADQNPCTKVHLLILMLLPTLE